MHRRQLLRATAGLGVPAVVGALSSRDGAARPTDPEEPSATTTGSPRPTATPTPTDAAATPTSGYEPLGSVAVEGATEAVTTPDGDTAFIAVLDGFAAVDLTEPADPTVLTEERDISPPGTTQVMEGVQDVKYDDGRLLVAGPANYGGDGFHGVALYDVSDPTRPERLRTYRTAFPIHNCDLAGGYAYLTGNNRDDNPLVVVDVGRDEPAEVARWSLFDHDDVWESVPLRLRSLHDVFVRDGFAYLAHWDAGTWILDVSEPANPSYVADVRERSPEELADLNGLAVAREGSEPPGNDHYAATDPDGSLLAVGKETWNSNFGKEGTTPGPDDPGGPSGIDLYDLADPTAPAHLATIDPPPTADPNVNGVWTTAHNFEIAAGHLYSSWYRGGVMVHDLSDPSNPERVRYFRRSSETSFWTAQLAAPGEAVVATSYADPSVPDAPARLYTFPDVARETPTPTDSPTAATTAPTGATASTGTTTEPTGSGTAPTPTGTGEGERSPTDAVETEGTTGGDGPGFGPAAALAGLGIGAWRLLGGVDTADEPGD
ncbi:LVIVD repeat-containing protein [Halosimplex amylolyticum]|uniref:LVIVD repeat-containing protein n=1 Tax=Halosimplex amylolyticum TaxID=3396616 RepID=UPI003F564FEB